MSRTRALVVVGLLIIFFVAGGILIYASGHKGGQQRTFNVTVTNATTMTPSTLQPVHLNDTVTINITSDTNGEVHLHNYDIAFDTKAGQVVSHTFKADRTCSCDIEWESTSHQLGTLEVSP